MENEFTLTRKNLIAQCQSQKNRGGASIVSRIRQMELTRTDWNGEGADKRYSEAFLESLLAWNKSARLHYHSNGVFDPQKYPFTFVAILKACESVLGSDAAESSIYRQINKIAAQAPDSSVGRSRSRCFTKRVFDEAVAWAEKRRNRRSNRSQEELPIDDVPCPWEEAPEPVQMPQSADSMLIQISEPNRKYLKSIEMGGGSPDAFINRLIDSYRL
jgi:hypothetical protein